MLFMPTVAPEEGAPYWFLAGYTSNHTFPSGLQAGDVLIGAASKYESTNAGYPSTPGVPTGFTGFDVLTATSTSGGKSTTQYRRSTTRSFYKLATGGETAGANLGSAYNGGVLMAFRCVGATAIAPATMHTQTTASLNTSVNFTGELPGIYPVILSMACGAGTVAGDVGVATMDGLTTQNLRYETNCGVGVFAPPTDDTYSAPAWINMVNSASSGAFYKHLCLNLRYA